jgi:DNA-binding response OmpR family regulator
MDGYQTVQEMTRQGWADGNLVCMLTAVIEPDNELHAASDVVREYVRKPFDPDELVNTVRAYLAYLA